MTLLCNLNKIVGNTLAKATDSWSSSRRSCTNRRNCTNRFRRRKWTILIVLRTFHIGFRTINVLLRTINNCDGQKLSVVRCPPSRQDPMKYRPTFKLIQSTFYLEALGYNLTLYKIFLKLRWTKRHRHIKSTFFRLLYSYFWFNKWMRFDSTNL